MNESTPELKSYTALFLPVAIYFELFLSTVAPFLNVYFIYLLRRPFFHPNLRLLLASVGVGETLMSLARILLIIHLVRPYLSDTAEYSVALFHSIFVYGYMDASVLFSVERMLATVFAAKYEKLQNVWLPLLATVLVALGNTLLAIYVNSMSLQEGKTRPGVLTHAVENDRVVLVLSVVMVANAAGLMAFLFISRYNRRRWKTELQQKLSHRYQIAENLRTARQLCITLFAALFLGLFLYAVNLYVLISDDASSFVARCLVQVHYLLNAFFASLMPCMFIKTHPRMWTTAKRHFCSPKVVGKVMTVAARSKSVQGEDGNTYFQQLQESWSTQK